MREIEPETLWAEDIVDAKRWSTLVESSPTPDVYYLPEYARATAEIELAEPLAVIAGAASARMLAPLLLRRMSAMIDGSVVEWLDASTPYGYGGLLSLSASDLIHPEHIRVFVDQQQLESTWCADRNVVCCVIRASSSDWTAGLVSTDGLLARPATTSLPGCHQLR